ncbi:MAG: hypothetical protein QXD03_05775 [Candidatus Anstonellales archaeon]
MRKKGNSLIELVVWVGNGVLILIMINMLIYNAYMLYKRSNTSDSYVYRVMSKDSLYCKSAYKSDSGVVLELNDNQLVEYRIQNGVIYRNNEYISKFRGSLDIDGSLLKLVMGEKIYTLLIN